MLSKRLARLIAAGATAAALGAAPGVARAESHGVPFPFPTGPFVVDGLCSFPVQLTFSGYGGELALPGGRFLDFGPGLSGTYANAADPSKSVTYMITGTLSGTEGSDVLVADGRNVISTADGLVLLVGHFTVNGDSVTGGGTQTAICPLIA
jgi:hypothetical protein